MRRTDEHPSQPGRGAAQDDPRPLRLARAVDAGPRESLPADDAPARPARVRADRRAHREWEVSAENRAAAAADISTFDARWVLAVRAADSIEGGRAAVLRPEARQRLVSTARGMGLRPFDANLVLAIVQDAAREGRTPRDLETIDRLMLVGEPERAARTSSAWMVLLLACSAVWTVAIVWWLVG